MSTRHPHPHPCPTRPTLLTHPLPRPPQVIKSKLTDAIVSHGSYLRECDINHAIIGLRSRIMENVTIQVRGGGGGGGGGCTLACNQHSLAHIAATAEKMPAAC